MRNKKKKKRRTGKKRLKNKSMRQLRVQLQMNQRRKMMKIKMNQRKKMKKIKMNKMITPTYKIKVKKVIKMIIPT